MEVLEFDDNLNRKNYHDWVQSVKRILELKGLTDEKRFKFSILNMK